MQERRWIASSLWAWGGVWAFWLAATRRFHPSLTLAVIVTTALVAAYAAAAYLNHLALIPRLWRPGNRIGYVAWLTVVMVTLTTSALVVIRVAYLGLLGPDPDPNGVYKHFAIDLCGMAVHLAAVMAVVGAIKVANGRAERCDPADPPAAGR
jgi:hypothetical protein